MVDELALEDDIRLIQRLSVAERVEVKCGQLHRNHLGNIAWRVEIKGAIRASANPYMQSYGLLKHGQDFGGEKFYATPRTTTATA